MRILVIGATGVVGRQLVPMLVGGGHQVTATTRSVSKAGGLAAAGAEPLVLDVLDTAATEAALTRARPEVVVYQATALTVNGGGDDSPSSRRSATAGTASSPGTATRQPDSAPVDLAEVRAASPAGARHRLRDARPALAVPVPQRRAAGAALPGGPGVPGRRRRARPLAGRRPGHEHRHAGRGEPRAGSWPLPYRAGAPTGLLDSYHGERHPVGRQVLRSSGLLIRLALIRSRWGRAARNAITRAAADSAVADRFAATISGIDLSTTRRRPGPTALSAPARPTSRSTTEAGSTRRCAMAGSCCSASARPSFALPAQVDAAAVPAQPNSARHRLVLVRPDGYVRACGRRCCQFPAWTSGHFRRRTQPVNR